MKVFNKDKALRQIKLKQNKNTYIKRISIVLSCFILLVGIMYFTFAKFEQNSEEYTLINGVVKYGGSGDIQLSYVVDGVSQNTPPAKGTGYKLKSVDCTNADGEWDKNKWGLMVYNLSGKAKCNLEFETTTEVEVTLYSAAEDEVYYYNNDEKIILGTTDATGKLENVTLNSDEITIYSSIAKNPDNLVENYNKTLTIDVDSKNVYLMPDGVIYWYGYGDFTGSGSWTFSSQINSKTLFNNSNNKAQSGTVNITTNLTFSTLGFILSQTYFNGNWISIGGVSLGSLTRDEIYYKVCNVSSKSFNVDIRGGGVGMRIDAIIAS